MTNEHPSQPQPAPRNAHQDNHESAPDHPPASKRGTSVALVIVAIAITVYAIFGILKRRQNDEVLARTTQENAAPTVIALAAKPGAAVSTITLPGNVTAFTDAPLYARTNGYLVRWYYDIGAKVKKGALLAEIAAPEVDQQVAQAQADLATAEANAGNAKNQAERYKGLVGSDAVSKQDTETFVTQAASTSAVVKSAQANVARLQQLQGFEKIYAPFDGTVTARGVDTGQLISEGSASELFHMQALQTLRVYTNIPEIYASSVKRGEKIDLTFPQYPGRVFQGTLVRTADAIDPSNRTLLVEVDIDNRKGELMPGSLAQVQFKTPSIGQTFIVPASALIFRREGMRVGTVTDQNGATIAHLVPVTIGIDDGATVQIITGLNSGDRIIQDPPDSLIEGQKVRVETPNSQNESQNTSRPQPRHDQDAQKPNGGQ
ncbi:efflux RND transporter periplasmic adaptor subunit [Occallatibacter riparius]|uniref:Efflux RND transporter periplasmic adaptor subunit n=1 Tax=Occallatibacter riparius TaxID=1002689 RepID=A0A9J7BPF6_9BACT|nr:efflux RND transporter periplasmic adaptor subunit [Occallatibacter riparius]UWZ84764.1 efflux RND transporter periplasmic adaptor subunit [Occallatibacter riparius]